MYARFSDAYVSNTADLRWPASTTNANAKTVARYRYIFIKGICSILRPELNDCNAARVVSTLGLAMAPAVSFSEFLAIKRRPYDCLAHLLHVALFMPLLTLRGIGVLTGFVCNIDPRRCRQLAERLCKHRNDTIAPWLPGDLRRIPFAGTFLSFVVFSFGSVHESAHDEAAHTHPGAQPPQLPAAADTPLGFHEAARTLFTTDLMLVFNEVTCVVMLLLELAALGNAAANYISALSAAHPTTTGSSHHTAAPPHASHTPPQPSATTAAPATSTPQHCHPRRRHQCHTTTSSPSTPPPSQLLLHQRLPFSVRWRGPILLAWRLSYNLLTVLSAATAPLPLLPATLAFLVSSCCPMCACLAHLARDCVMLVGGPACAPGLHLLLMPICRCLLRPVLDRLLRLLAVMCHRLCLAGPASTGTVAQPVP